jgi:hypothetical protein
MLSDNVLQVAKYAERMLPLSSARLSDEYYYQSLPLCVIDAVYSLNVRYSSVQNVVARYCDRFALPRTRDDKTHLPSPECQQSLGSFCRQFKERGAEEMAVSIFKNRCRTSPTNGILKSEAAFRFAAVLRKYRIEYLQDCQVPFVEPAMESEIRQIPGQASGISLKYFWMLAGDDGIAKPDRWILEFLTTALGRDVAITNGQALLQGAVSLLKPTFPTLTVRLLDHEIWKFQRALPSEARTARLRSSSPICG